MATTRLSLIQTSGSGGSSARVPLSIEGSRPPIRSLYIHVPFCFHKCHYCDFYSFVDTRDQQPAFVERLVRELAALAPHAAGAPLETIFVGGGTPSLLRVELWERLLGEMGSLFDLSAIRRDEGEFTVECNPETVTPELMGVLKAGGVDRVSVGAQSFEPRHLKTLERWHEPGNVEKAIEMARAAGIERRSIDLIYAIPGQTLDEWARDLDRALAMGLEHVSCYALTYEPNTPMAKRLSRGEFEPAPEELDVEMFNLATEKLGGAGLSRYEVSNYARPGQESQHNLVYWRQGQWLAAGPSASGHAWASSGDGTWGGGSHRWKNVPRLGDYLAGDDAGYAPIVDHEPPEPLRLISERLMMGLRLREGLAGDEILAEVDLIAPGAAERLRAAVTRLVDRGWLEATSASGGVWRVTAQGWLFVDAAAGELMRCVER